MDTVIKDYVKECEPFNRVFGDNGLVKLEQSAISPKLLDFTITAEKGHGRPLDADDLKSIGVTMIGLASELNEWNEIKRKG